MLPERLHLVLQLWQVTVKSPLRSHSKRPIMELRGPCGFGCADFNPGKGGNPNRGFYC